MAFGQKTSEANLHLLEEQAALERERTENARLKNELDRFNLLTAQEQKARTRLLSIYDNRKGNLEETLGILSHDSNAQRDFKLATGNDVSTILGGVESEHAQASQPYSVEDILSGRQPVGQGEKFFNQYDPIGSSMSPTEIALTGERNKALDNLPPGFGLAQLFKETGLGSSDVLRASGVEQLSKRPPNVPVNREDLSFTEQGALAGMSGISSPDTHEQIRSTEDINYTNIQLQKDLARLTNLRQNGSATPEQIYELNRLQALAPILSAQAAAEGRKGAPDLITPAEVETVSRHEKDLAEIQDAFLEATTNSKGFYNRITGNDTLDSPLTAAPGQQTLPPSARIGSTPRTLKQMFADNVRAVQSIELSNNAYTDYTDYVVKTDDGQFVPFSLALKDKTLKVQRDDKGLPVKVPNLGLFDKKGRLLKEGYDLPMTVKWPKSILQGPAPAAAPEVNQAPSAISPDVSKNLGILGIKPNHAPPL